MTPTASPHVREDVSDFSVSSKREQSEADLQAQARASTREHEPVEATTPASTDKGDGRGDADAVLVYTPAYNDDFGAYARGREPDVSPAQQSNMNMLLMGEALAAREGLASLDPDGPTYQTPAPAQPSPAEPQSQARPYAADMDYTANAPNRAALNADVADFSVPSSDGAQQDAAKQVENVSDFSSPSALANVEAARPAPERTRTRGMDFG